MNSVDFVNNPGGSLDTRGSGVANSANPGAVSNQTGVTNGSFGQDQDKPLTGAQGLQDSDLTYHGYSKNGWTNNIFGKLIDSIFLGGSHQKEADIDYQNWLNQHASQLRMQDLRNAGLNPLLAGMSVGAPNSSIYKPAGKSGGGLGDLLALIGSIASMFAG